MNYRFRIDLRDPPAQPPEDGFLSSGDEVAPPEPQLQVLAATVQLEAVYRRLAEQVVRARLGRSQAGDELRHCFVAAGFKHLLLRDARTPHERLTEIRLADDGNLVRRVYERMGGELQTLEDLFERGLSGLDQDERRFSACPGYELRFARYSVRQGRLQKVRMGRASFHAEHGRIVITAL